MCKMFGKEPDDSWFEEMEPVKKLWLYESWAHELELELEKEKSLAILIGSFSNPEMAQKMISRENPEYVSSDDEFEQSWQAVKQHIQKEEENKNPSPKRKRRRKKVING